MDFMDQVKQTAVNVAQTVAQKSNELVEISKIKYEVYDLNNDIKKLYLEIGKLVYEELRESTALTEDIQIKCEIIEAKKARIAALKTKENQMKKGITCPVCGRECGEEQNYCPHCGADLAVEAEVEVPHVVIREEKAEPAKAAEPMEAAEKAEPAETLDTDAEDKK
ncbi:zinc ribbon domain-containing protein [Ructibacterium gallinarum]|uniref:Zinc ribbon domain-containing protein n=1 Tax=Ructibacterium gallinarum TaxID=2779355 RepID=A0A9D5R8W8_9FIRM|nr:zinc ribbon domain-containing protein [Ructibacterium gallinarum]MBE5040407.1 zinc ribbon domain-containing protein [Ructibacterium gallinarum]